MGTVSDSSLRNPVWTPRFHSHYRTQNLSQCLYLYGQCMVSDNTWQGIILLRSSYFKASKEQVEFLSQKSIIVSGWILVMPLISNLLYALPCTSWTLFSKMILNFIIVYSFACLIPFLCCAWLNYTALCCLTWRLHCTPSGGSEPLWSSMAFCLGRHARVYSW